ncbi:hydrophobic surface binding protein A-domain-containing protein [Mycena leptocephala]|nr:hydrophobic surface binding protein A-domain-containing protein [Mycena leptocephala]
MFFGYSFSDCRVITQLLHQPRFETAIKCARTRAEITHPSKHGPALSLNFSLSLLAAGVATPLKRTVAQVESDIANISSQVTTLDNNIKAFPGSAVVFQGIHSAAGNLESILNKATSDVNATGAVSEADAMTILHSVEALEPTILDSLSQISTKRAAFDSQPISGLSALVKADLQTLKTDTDAFANALIAAAPADLKAEAMTILTNVDNGFNSAIAAYS